MENWTRIEGIAFIFGFIAPFLLLWGGLRATLSSKKGAGRRSLYVGCFMALFYFLFGPTI